MAAPDCSEEVPPQKKSRLSLGKCPNPSAAKKCSPNFARMVQAALATPLHPPEAIRAHFETARLLWMGIDIETHRLVPSTADTWWRPGQFGFMTRLTNEVLTELRVVQIGWTIGTFGSAPTTKERLVQPDGFEISDDATEKHGVSHSVAATQGEPLVRCLRELLDDIALLKLQGGRLCSHNLEFDAGILMEEMNRSELADLAESFAEAVR